MIRPAALAALLLLTAAPAGAQSSGTGALLCFNNRGAYVARVTFDYADAAGAWINSSRVSTAYLENVCQRMPSRVTRTRVTVEGHTGFEWRRACQHEFRGGDSAQVWSTGTSLNQACAIY